MTDEKIIEAAREFREGLLDGGSPNAMCFAVSAPLAGLLEWWGVPARIEEYDTADFNHVFIVLGDGRVLDATGDQFNGLDWLAGLPPMPPIYLGPRVPQIHGRLP